MNKHRERLQPADTLRVRLQQQCSDWGTYWRAPDAHGVIINDEQALELLRTALGVEVEIKSSQLTAKAAAPAPVRVSGIPGNVLTHRNAWRKAIEQAMATAAPKTEDTDDRAYWAHELAAFDRTFDRLAQLIFANDVPAPAIGEVWEDSSGARFIRQTQETRLPPPGTKLYAHPAPQHYYSIAQAALAWWEDKRPVRFTLTDHIANPIVNCVGGSEGDLAIAIAAIVK